MSSESGKALKALATAIKTMKHPESADEHVEKAKNAAKGLKAELEAAAIEDSDLLAIVSAAAVASILAEIVECVEKISQSVNELSQMARFKKVQEATISPEIGAKSGHSSSSLLHRGSVKPVLDCENVAEENQHVIITVHEIISTDHSPGNVVRSPHVPKT